MDYIANEIATMRARIDAARAAAQESHPWYVPATRQRTTLVLSAEAKASLRAELDARSSRSRGFAMFAR